MQNLILRYLFNATVFSQEIRFKSANIFREFCLNNLKKYNAEYIIKLS